MCNRLVQPELRGSVQRVRHDDDGQFNQDGAGGRHRRLDSRTTGALGHATVKIRCKKDKALGVERCPRFAVFACATTHGAPGCTAPAKCASSPAAAADRLPRPVRDLPLWTHCRWYEKRPDISAGEHADHPQVRGCISTPCADLTSPIARCARMLQGAARARPASLARVLW